MRELVSRLDGRKIKPHISGRYALADTPQAWNDMGARKVTGKVAILPQK